MPTADSADDIFFHLKFFKLKEKNAPSNESSYKGQKIVLIKLSQKK